MQDWRYDREEDGLLGGSILQKILQTTLVHVVDVSPMLPAGGPLDDKHLLPEVSTLFMAGFESESALLWWLC